MAVKRVSPSEAHDLMQKEGYVYVDVRSIPEFGAGHPLGSCNVPLMHLGPTGMAPNPEFLAVMEKAFTKDARLIIGCKMGGRSARAAGILESAGFTQVVDQKAGFDGQGEPGWVALGLPTSTEARAENTYEGLKAR